MDHNSLKSSRGKLAVPSSSCKNPSGPDEESGWTSYFEDFSKGNIIEPSHCSSSSLGGSSLLSDAASSAAWKFSHHHNNNHHHVVISSSSDKGAPNLPKKLCFKKARTKQISEDDPLEDTASSPVNSPKVRDLSPTNHEIVSRKIDDQLQGSMGKGLKSENHSDLHDKNELDHFNGKNIDCTELKKRGLCLVPLSLLVNYLG